MAGLSDHHDFLMTQENHTEQMKDMSIVEKFDIKDMPANCELASSAEGVNGAKKETANGELASSAERAGADQKGRKTKKEDKKREDLMAALSDPRSYFAAEVKRVQQKQTAANGKSDIKDVHANGAANGTKKSSKTNKNHENRDDLMAALSDPRSYFAAQVKPVQQKKDTCVLESDAKNFGGADAVKKRSETKKGTKNVCIII